ncbi:AAA family ATPase [Caldalkalibacillus mannanilyticus]|uniref:AAA family ATPase n=1 Tax=Caldalkalibacillus mannanilyticus TaxID=1418 RepID=UPI000558FC69|nr:MoxR family ATPase [Caldalkalibacillus mannanilyticus]
MRESKEIQASFDTYHPKMNEVIQSVNKVMIGKNDMIELVLVAIMSGGHVLLEDVPGVGKTMLVRSLARSLGCEFKRIQFTPDLLPSDVTGVSIYNQKELNFEFREGPIFGNIILADEINRTSPKTQSALLEAMEEGNITVDGETRRLPLPFNVIATQNPIEYEGTFPLPEAQLDRFLLKLRMGYPTLEEEVEVLSRAEKSHPIENVHPVISLSELQELQKEVRMVHVDHSLKEYMVQLTQATREHPNVYLGASPRGSLALLRASQALAFIRGREFVIPDDVKQLAPYTLEHRMILKSESRLSGATVQTILEDVMSRIKVPIIKEPVRQ